MGTVRPKRKTRKSGAVGWVVVALVMLAVGLLGGYLIWGRTAPDPAMNPAKKSPRMVAPASPRKESQNHKAVPGRSGTPDVTPQDSRPKIALVIDDLGYAPPELVVRLCAQQVPLTVAVLPFQEHTRRSAEIAHEAGKEVMLHLPMEPLGYPGPSKDPGPGAIFFGMGEGEVRRSVQAAMANIPFRRGVNNHMGSRITPDRRRMRWILEEVQRRGLYFVDSRTEKDSVAFDVAVDLKLPSIQRRVFLDDDRSDQAIVQQWRRAEELARKEGEVLVIGHIVPETLGALERLIPASRQSFTFVTAGELVQGRRKP